MNQKTVGVVGCTLLAVAIVVGGSVVFFEKAIVAAGIPYHFVGYSLGAAALCVGAVACGYLARVTTAGKVALFGGAAIGVSVIGYFALVLTAFSIGG